MIYLFIDTHSRDLNLGLVKDSVLLDEIKIQDLETHSNLFLCELEKLLKKNNLIPNDIDKIIVVNGPGSFTGIRIGMTGAKVYAWGLKKEIVTISSLKSYALSLEEYDYAISLIDARRGYVYASIYDKNMNAILEESYIPLTEVIEKANKLEGTKKYMGNIVHENLDVIKPNLKILNIVNHCKDIPTLNPHVVNPNYLKKTEAEENHDNKS